MNLTIDIGNTSTKVVLFEQDEPVFRKLFLSLKAKDLLPLLKRFPVEHSILSSVIHTPPGIPALLRKNSAFLLLDHRTALPVRNKYRTPETLGKDRIAGVIGAAALFPGRNCLVIDAGTCIKLDIINDRNEYLGGSISPGLSMRFKALHAFTGKLPEIRPAAGNRITGRSTKESILSGVQEGILFEMEGFIRRYKKEYSRLQLILTGGDAPRFARRLNLPIFAAPDLVNIGLNEILKFHVSN